MKILYAAGLSPNDSSLYRLQALERQGHTVVSLNAYQYRAESSFLKKVEYRLQVGPNVARLNRDLLELVRRERPDILWADKLLFLWPSTLDRLQEMGVVTVSYMIDNAFGPRRDPGWRLYMKCIPHWDLHAVQRDQNITDYKAQGARDVIKIQTAYEPTIHFPPPEGWSDKDRDRNVSFIGTPYDNRPEFLTRLWKEFGVDVALSGNRIWRTLLSAEAAAAIYRSEELYRDAYREGIWRSKINLSFLTHSNQDEFAHKSFEIAACGGFLLAERSEGHRQKFVEDEEAVFFSDIEECVAKIRLYLPDEAARARIAAAGRARAERDGYHNDRQVERIMERAGQIVARMRDSRDVSR